MESMVPRRTAVGTSVTLGPLWIVGTDRRSAAPLARSRTEEVTLAMAGGPEGVLPWILAGGVAIAALALAMVRVVPEHERAVVLRFGRVARVGGPGLTALLPAVERVVRISLRESRLESLVAQATTRDDVTVRVTVTASFRVVDPVRSYLAVSDLYARTAEAIHAVIRAEVSRTDLGDLAHSSTWCRERIIHEANSILARWGTELNGIEIVTIDVQLTSELLHWAERLPQARNEVHGTRAG
jgi:regulator of protease activity HflC (stomatin/prohibitin superfamily)